ncbi:hypothetical protein BGW39_008403 [Mortierella sp. 14UC]|nr:hypothetical protein BGW39_008403 [Mortierella sp. 14UC]
MIPIPGSCFFTEFRDDIDGGEDVEEGDAQEQQQQQGRNGNDGRAAVGGMVTLAAQRDPHRASDGQVDAVVARAGAGFERVPIAHIPATLRKCQSTHVYFLGHDIELLSYLKKRQE